LTAASDALLAESVDGSTSEQTAACFAWETSLRRRLPVMTYRMVASLAQAPIEELGESSLASALVLLRISATEANRRVKEARDLGPRTCKDHSPVLHEAARLHRLRHPRGR
jgi:hypothetical protein